MKQTILILFLFFLAPNLFAQDIAGKWQGSFSASGNGKYKLELQIENEGESVKGIALSSQSKDFYGKASVTGTWNPGMQNLVIKEESMDEVKIKGGGDDACKMTYDLTYKKVKNKEYLEGTFVTSNMRDGTNCGNGTVKLERPAAKDTTQKEVAVKKEKVKKEKPSKPEPVAKKETEKAAEKPVVKEEVVVKKETPAPEPVAIKVPANPLKERTNELFETITSSAKEVTIDFYDNGEIDGDTISVYDNSILRTSGKGLSTLPISLKISFENNEQPHEIVMVAENLGSIPPNTALMIVQAGTERYNVRLTSTEKKNAMVIIKYKAPN
jgi:hypothetical protein